MVVLRTYLSDSNDHVANVGLERVDGAGLLVATEPNTDANKSTVPLLGALLHLFELASNVREVFLDLTPLALDSNFPCIHRAFN